MGGGTPKNLPVEHAVVRQYVDYSLHTSLIAKVADFEMFVTPHLSCSLSSSQPLGHDRALHISCAFLLTISSSMRVSQMPLA